MKRKLLIFSALLVTSLGLAACSGTKEEKQVESEQPSSNVVKKETVKEEFKIGDRIVFDGEVAITITGATYTDERNQFEESDPLHVLVVTYNVENLSDDEYLAWRELDLYVNNKKMESYPVSMFISEKLPAGRSFEGATVGFAITEEGEYELEVKPSTFGSEAKPQIVKFVVE